MFAVTLAVVMIQPPQPVPLPAGTVAHPVRVTGLAGDRSTLTPGQTLDFAYTSPGPPRTTHTFESVLLLGVDIQPGKAGSAPKDWAVTFTFAVPTAQAKAAAELEKGGAVADVRRRHTEAK